jgi:hypothetical protein
MNEPKKRKNLRLVIWVAIALLLAYPLSTGPIALLTGSVSPDNPIWRPLYWAGEQCPPFAALMMLYWSLWVPLHS